MISGPLVLLPRSIDILRYQSMQSVRRVRGTYIDGAQFRYLQPGFASHFPLSGRPLSIYKLLGRFWIKDKLCELVFPLEIG